MEGTEVMDNAVVVKRLDSKALLQGPTLEERVAQMKAEWKPTAEEVEEMRTALLAEELEAEVKAAEAAREAAMPRATVVTVNEPKGEDRAKAEKERNAMTQIEQIEGWLFREYEFRRNVVNEVLEYRRQGEEDFREMLDEDENDIIYHLKRRGFKRPQDDLRTLLYSSAVPTINPVREYYDGLHLHHPGAMRRLMDSIVLDDIEVTIGGRNYRQLFEEYFEKWLTACYLCNVGVQRNDVMLILIGAQGRYKSSFLNHLCPETMQQYLHCGNIMPSISEYNTATYLVERMLVNVDDQMDHIFGKDYNSMKSIITADFVSRRTLYSKRAKNRRRIANFCGSVNESHFLRDSNNRRYLCFKIKDILPSYQDVDMDDVMAEVKMAADARGVRYVFGKEDFATIDQMNECFMTPTEEDEALHTCFAPTQAGQKGAYLMQFTELLKVLRQMTGNNQLRQFNLQTAMRKYGFESRMMRSRAHAYPCNLFAVSIVARDPDARNSLELLCRAWREEESWSWTDVSG